MSLLDKSMESVVMLEKKRSPDGQGGFITAYEEGAVFNAAITFDASMTARIAEAQGVKSRYTITTRKNVVLEYHDVIKRLADGKIFRITSDGEDKFTPVSASLNMRHVTAEEWRLPT